jgi:DNA-binding PadR family transcriptional regulator
METLEPFNDFDASICDAIDLLQEKARGIEIHKKVEELTGKQVNPGIIYVRLDRLLKGGLIESYEPLLSAEKKTVVFILTKQGKELLGRWRTR